MSDTFLGKTLINFITKIVLLLGYKLWQLTGEIGLIFLKKNVVRAVSQGVTLMFLGIISVIVMYFVPPYQPPLLEPLLLLFSHLVAAIKSLPLIMNKSSGQV